MSLIDVRTTEILLQPEAWAQASDANRDAYERKAKDLGIRLAHDEDPGAHSMDVVVLVREGGYVPQTFKLTARCPLGRAAWEHVVRRELGLPDPCL